MELKHKGFTLLEVIAAIVIGAIATGALIWSIPGIQNISKVHMACTKAASINTAKSMFLNYKGSTGVSVYGSAGSHEAKFALVRGYIPYTGSDIALADYTPKGFTIEMNALNEKVTLKQNGKEIEY
jgi:prepilin-type N-terminal cleavage/methylation domain-containing protein